MTPPKIRFVKYQATGNDFILIDNRDGNLKLSRAEIARLCNRRYGIGADGLILLGSAAGFDFEMKNYNSDGGECSMCGNGGRALIRFARDLGVIGDSCRFLAIDGIHEGGIEGDQIRIRMQSVDRVRETPAGPALDTGSPHLVVGIHGLMNHDVVREGRALRNSPLFMPGGINVNFIEENSGRIFIRTYERGVEDETLSCGTGAIAAALVSHQRKHNPTDGAPVEIPVHCQGGVLLIRFTQTGGSQFEKIDLIGPVEKTFEGTL